MGILIFYGTILRCEQKNLDTDKHGFIKGLSVRIRDIMPEG